jgi:hypothetical protein
MAGDAVTTGQKIERILDGEYTNFGRTVHAYAVWLTDIGSRALIARLY